MKLFKLLPLLLFTVAATRSWAQTQTDLPGDWNVTKVFVTDKTGEISPETIKKIENMFMQTQFHFKADGVFAIDSPQKALQFKKSNWSFNDKDKSVSVNGTDMADKTGLLLKLFVKNENAKWYFELDEAPIKLEVEKSVKK